MSRNGGEEGREGGEGQLLLLTVSCLLMYETATRVMKSEFLNLAYTKYNTVNSQRNTQTHTLYTCCMCMCVANMTACHLTVSAVSIMIVM